MPQAGPRKKDRPGALENELKRARQNMDLAERAAHFGYWRMDLATQDYYWSAGMYRILDAPLSMKPDAEWIFSQVRPEDRATIDNAIAQAIRTRSPFFYRVYARNPDAKAQIVDTQGEVEVGPDGRVVSVLGVCHDVTLQVRAEEAREKAQKMYRVMAEEASDIIMLYEPDGRIVFASNALYTMTKRTIEEIGGDRFLDLVHPSDRTEVQRLQTLPKPGETVTVVYRTRHKDGHYLWIESKVRGVYDEETGAFKNLISVSRDVTQRKLHELEMNAARERAELANRAKSTFLANMSHELRTPLNAIIGFAELMRRRMFGSLGHPRYDEYASLIHESGQLLLDLISDILDMAKIEAGKLELNLETVDLKEAVADCVRLVQQRADQGGVAISVAMDEMAKSLVADRRAVKQVLLNLLSNAVKFTPAGGHVQVNAASRGERVVVTVRDDGVGIPESEIDRLGQPFEQVCADPMLAKAGSGLGLALVRALAEKHGGSLRIESHEGRGTAVSVELPLRAKRHASAA
jgi:PAS domain S-box-containing protein